MDLVSFLLLKMPTWKKEQDKPRNRVLTTEKELMATGGQVGGGMGKIGDGD